MILRLSKNLIGNEGAIALGKNTVWKNLRLLDLSDNRIEREGAIGLAGNTSWSELKELHLQHNLLDDESSFALGRNSSWGNSEKLLVLEGNPKVSSARQLIFALNAKISNEFNCEPEESQEKDLVEILINEKEAQFKKYFEQILTDCRDERKEELLKFWNDREKFGAASMYQNGFQNLNEYAHLSWSLILEIFNACGCPINDEGTSYISKNMSWKNLKQIDLSHTMLSDKEVAIIAKNTFWTNLQSLDLSISLIGDEGCSSLAQNSTWKLLESLNLAKKAITDKGVAYFSENKGWSQIKMINLNENKLTTIQSVNFLANNKNWKVLSRISVQFNKFTDDDIVAFLNNYDPAASPFIEIDCSRQMHCLNIKYSQKLSEFKEHADFEDIVNKMDEQFEQEIHQLQIRSSQSKS